MVSSFFLMQSTKGAKSLTFDSMSFLSPLFVLSSLLISDPLTPSTVAVLLFTTCSRWTSFHWSWADFEWTASEWVVNGDISSLRREEMKYSFCRLHLKFIIKVIRYRTFLGSSTSASSTSPSVLGLNLLH